MNHLRLFENFSEIKHYCSQFFIYNYKINEDGTIDVLGDVLMRKKNLSEIPIKFRYVSGDFDCGYNKLTSLDGCPKKVGGGFSCMHNRLESLSGGPENVGGDYYCDRNLLVNLIGSPRNITGNFLCRNNLLKSLEGGPNIVDKDFFCQDNDLSTLDGFPSHIGGNFMFSGPLYGLSEKFPNFDAFKSSLDWNYLSGNKIIKSRFQDACDEIGMDILDYPQGIGYTYI